MEKKTMKSKFKYQIMTAFSFETPTEMIFLRSSKVKGCKQRQERSTKFGENINKAPLHNIVRARRKTLRRTRTKQLRELRAKRTHFHFDKTLIESHFEKGKIRLRPRFDLPDKSSGRALSGLVAHSLLID